MDKRQNTKDILMWIRGYLTVVGDGFNKMMVCREWQLATTLSYVDPLHKNGFRI